MLVLNVTYKLKKAGTAKEFYEKITAAGIEAASCAENGNSMYRFYAPMNADDELFLLEHWKDEEALALHRTFPHYAALAAIKEDYVSETIIDRSFSKE